MALIFDTETTGLPDFRQPSDAPHQPHLVQLALVEIGTGYEEIEAVAVIVRPDGWTISPEVSAIHGITHEMAMDVGIREADAVAMFVERARRADRHVAHNINFDRRIMRIAMLRHGLAREEIEAIEAMPWLCTMRAADPIMKLPPTDRMRAAGFTKSKAPNLTECIKHFFQEDLAGAHDALVDARACVRVLRAIEELAAAKTAVA